MPYTSCLGPSEKTHLASVGAVPLFMQLTDTLCACSALADAEAALNSRRSALEEAQLHGDRHAQLWQEAIS